MTLNIKVSEKHGGTRVPGFSIPMNYQACSYWSLLHLAEDSLKWNFWEFYNLDSAFSQPYNLINHITSASIITEWSSTKFVFFAFFHKICYPYTQGWSQYHIRCLTFRSCKDSKHQDLHLELSDFCENINILSSRLYRCYDRLFCDIKKGPLGIPFTRSEGNLQCGHCLTSWPQYLKLSMRLVKLGIFKSKKGNDFYDTCWIVRKSSMKWVNDLFNALDYNRVHNTDSKMWSFDPIAFVKWGPVWKKMGCWTTESWPSPKL